MDAAARDDLGKVAIDKEVVEKVSQLSFYESNYDSACKWIAICFDSLLLHNMIDSAG